VAAAVVAAAVVAAVGVVVVVVVVVAVVAEPVYHHGTTIHHVLRQIALVGVVARVAPARPDEQAALEMTRGVPAVLIAAHIEGLYDHVARTQTAASRVVFGVAQLVVPHKLLVEVLIVVYAALPVVARLKKLRRLHVRLELARCEDCNTLQEGRPNLDVANVEEYSRTIYRMAVLQRQCWVREIDAAANCSVELDVPSPAASS
jgi:hypothetical protein